MRNGKSGDNFHCGVEVTAHQQQGQQKQNMVVTSPNMLDTQLEKVRKCADAYLAFDSRAARGTGDLEHVNGRSKHLVSQYPAIDIMNGRKMGVVCRQVRKECGAYADPVGPFSPVIQRDAQIVF